MAAQYLVDNPFADACASQPQRVMLVLAQPPTAEQAAEQAPEQAAEHLRSRAAPGEHVCAVGCALWIHFSAAVAASKLTPAFIDKCVGAPATARNWRNRRNRRNRRNGRTVQALAAMLE